MYLLSLRPTVIGTMCQYSCTTFAECVGRGGRRVIVGFIVRVVTVWHSNMIASVIKGIVSTQASQADWLLDSTHNKSGVKQSVCMACLCWHNTLRHLWSPPSSVVASPVSWVLASGATGASRRGPLDQSLYLKLKLVSGFRNIFRSHHKNTRFKYFQKPIKVS